MGGQACGLSVLLCVGVPKSLYAGARMAQSTVGNDRSSHQSSVSVSHQLTVQSRGGVSEGREGVGDRRALQAIAKRRCSPQNNTPMNKSDCSREQLASPSPSSPPPPPPPPCPPATLPHLLPSARALCPGGLGLWYKRLFVGE